MEDLLYKKPLDFNDQCWQQLFRSGNLKEYNSNEVMFRQNEANDHLYCIIEGMIKNVVYFPNGTEKTIFISKAPAITGESSTFDDIKEHFTTSIAISHVVCVVIQKEEVRKAISLYPEILTKLFQILSLKARSFQTQAEDVYATIPKRLARLLLHSHQYGIFIQTTGNSHIALKHSELASLLGTTRPRITKFLNEFEMQGFIENKRGDIYVKNYQKLTEYYNNF